MRVLLSELSVTVGENLERSVASFFKSSWMSEGIDSKFVVDKKWSEIVASNEASKRG
jgi:hypothetical protein